MSDMPQSIEPADPERLLLTARGKLTPAEIEALLRPDLSDLEPPTPVTAPLPAGDFAAPAPALATDHDRDFARRLAARLSLAMRESCGVQAAASIAGTRRAPFEMAVRQGNEERGQAIACFAMRGGDTGAMLILSPGFAQLLIETACGARDRSGPIKPLSPIDLALLEALVRPLARAISPDLHFASLETDGAFAATISPPSDALAAEHSVRVQGEAFRVQLILAGSLAAPVTQVTPAAAEPAPSRQAATGTGALTFAVTARVASLAVPLSKLSGLKPGATLLLGVPSDQPVELVSGGVLVAEAEIGRRGGRVALRVTRRGPAIAPISRLAT